ncbi:DnaB-like helicase N-terminal domain-containing protein [Streptomyces sp. NPDC048256]|uniref:DnaB-like helicase N-terminal domain-containing protein n=1 Tax=Streptomyces sp. NPDC048256 TaxID=3154613 RepID=UPI0034096B2B
MDTLVRRPGGAGRKDQSGNKGEILVTVEDADAALHHPHDLHAEKAVLKAMLQSKDAIADIVDVLGGHDFYRPAHDLIYTTVLELYGSGQSADPLNVAAHLTKQDRLEEIGGSAYLTALMAGPSPSKSWMAEAERVQSAAMLRRTKIAAIHIENMASDGAAGTEFCVEALNWL